MTQLELFEREYDKVYRGQVQWPDGELSNADALWLPEWVVWWSVN